MRGTLQIDLFKTYGAGSDQARAEAIVAAFDYKNPAFVVGNRKARITSSRVGNSREKDGWLITTVYVGWEMPDR